MTSPRENVLDKFIPTKMTSPRENLTWLSKSLLASIRKKHLYIAKPSVRIKLTFEQSINYVNGRYSMPSGLPSVFFKQTLCIFRTKNSKPLWSYINYKRQDGNGVSPLKENGQLQSDCRRKAIILDNQFCSVFTSRYK